MVCVLNFEAQRCFLVRLSLISGSEKFCSVYTLTSVSERRFQLSYVVKNHMHLWRDTDFKISVSFYEDGYFLFVIQSKIFAIIVTFSLKALNALMSTVWWWWWWGGGGGILKFAFLNAQKPHVWHWIQGLMYIFAFI